jgi:chemotaxis methyl-accepting protein methylase
MSYLYFQGVTKSPKPRLPRAVEAPLRPRIASTDSESRGQDFFQALFDLTGLPRNSYRHAFLQRRLPACLRFLGVRSLDAALPKLRAQPELATALLNVVLLGVTEFYRDEPVFLHLRDALLPAWLHHHQPLRIWSAACSDGHELYSVALLLAKAGLLGTSELLGTDFRADAIAKARDGTFATDTHSKLSATWASEHFKADRAGARIHESLRGSITWKRADLLAGAEPGPWHLILWRNMAIYLEHAAATRTWQSLAAELRPGGYLITGKADYPPPGLGLIRVAPCIHQKKIKH